MPLARRFVLPLALLVAAVASWFVADRLGSTGQAVGTGTDTVALEAPLVSVRRLPDLVTRSARQATVAEAITALPSDPGGLSCVRVIVAGQVVLDVRGDSQLVPGYAQLMTTGHVAMEVLGPEYRFETRVMAEARPDADGRVYSSVYLVGGGDPVLMTYGYSHGFRPVQSTRTSVEELADLVVDAGVVTIDGGIIAVESRYDTERVLPGWPVEYTESGLAGPLSALQLDDGFAERVSPDGTVPAVAADDPAAVAAARFDDLLERRAITVAAASRSLATGEQLPELIPIATIESPALRNIVFQMMAVNDASAAEMLLKEIGLARSGTGSTQAGGRVVQQVLDAQGIELSLPPRDGSGLDPVGATTCRDLAEVIDTIPDGHPTLEVLPAYDLPGVFDGAFAGIEIAADLRLVGGRVGDAGGFVARTVGDGHRITIASIVNRRGGPTDADLAYQQSLLGVVDRLQASAALEALAVGD